MKPAPSWLGKKLGHFRLVGQVGEGAMGKVFRAEDMSLGRHVALKVFPRQMKQGDKTVDLGPFLNEARSSAILDHPHIVRVYEAAEAGGVFYIAMELIEGGNLRQLVTASGPMDVVRACQLTSEAADALEYAHGMGVIHRDVKPANLLLTRAGRCKLTDFGLAHVENSADGFKLPTECVGTPQFVSPEVVLGNPATTKSDVYSLGASLWYLLTGKPPFEAESAGAMMQMHVNNDLPNLKKIRPDVPDGLVNAIGKAMAKDPADRFTDVARFAGVLRVHTIPVGSSMTGSMSGTAPVTGSQNGGLLIWGGVAGAIVAIVGVVIGIYFVMPDPTKPAPVVSAPVVPEPPVAAVAAPEIMKSTAPREVVAPAEKIVSAKEVIPSENVAPPEIVAPPQQVVRVEKSPAPGVSAAASVLLATDAGTLKKIAAGSDARSSKSIVVEGTIESVRVSSSGKVASVNFAGVDGEGFYAAYFPANKMFEQMATRFGGDRGAGLAGKTVRVRGVVEEFKGRPQVVIKSPDQVEIVSP